MKRVNQFLFFLITIIVFGGCEEPPIVFTEPQPSAIEAERFINPIYRGRFLCESDSATLVIKNDIIYKEKPFQLKMSQAELAELNGNVVVKDQQLYIPEWDRYLAMEEINDTIYAEFMLTDTLVHLGTDHVLKYFRGYLVINRPLDKNKWEVLLLGLDEHLNLSLSIPVLPEQIEQLEEITPVKDISNEDQLQYLLSPTLIEFNELLRTRLIFSECDYFYRLQQQLET